MTGNPAYSTGLEKNEANYTPLTPLTFLDRAAYVYPNRTSVVHGDQRFTWRETYARCRRLASALSRRGIGKNDTVAVMAPNIPAMYEAHFGVPMCGAVLNTLNTRLDAPTLAFMLRHGGARALLTDREFAPAIEAALSMLDQKPLVIDIDDPLGAARQVARRDRLTRRSSRRRSGVRLANPARRVGRDRAQLHLRHDGRSQGRRVSPSRRLPQRDQRHPRLEHAAARRSISGRCRCFIATAGAFPGRSPSAPG